jgi:hypothetical protein
MLQVGATEEEEEEEEEEVVVVVVVDYCCCFCCVTNMTSYFRTCTNWNQLKTDHV